MDLTKIILAIIGIIHAVLVSFVIPVLKNKYSEQQLLKVNKIIKTFVYAADQLFDKEMGEEKKQWVREKLIAAGYDVNLDEIDAQIEAYVLELHNQLRPRDDAE